MGKINTYTNIIHPTIIRFPEEFPFKHEKNKEEKKTSIIKHYMGGDFNTDP